MTSYDAILFYMIGAMFVGAIVASAKTVEVKWGARQLPFPRLLGGIIGGAVWPLTLCLIRF